jgi:hypothetical protein
MKNHFLVNLETERCNCRNMTILILILLISIIVTGIWGFFVSDYYICSYHSLSLMEKSLLTYSTTSDQRKNIILFVALKRLSVNNLGLKFNLSSTVSYHEDADTLKDFNRISSVTCFPNIEMCDPV